MPSPGSRPATIRAPDKRRKVETSKRRNVTTQPSAISRQPSGGRTRAAPMMDVASLWVRMGAGGLECVLRATPLQSGLGKDRGWHIGFGAHSWQERCAEERCAGGHSSTYIGVRCPLSGAGSRRRGGYRPCAPGGYLRHRSAHRQWLSARTSRACPWQPDHRSAWPWQPGGETISDEPLRRAGP